MQFSVGRKIFSIAVVTLALMLVVAFYSLHLISNIADDLSSVSKRQIPVAEGVARINVHVLEQAVLLERLLVDAPQASVETSQRNRMTQLDAAVEKEFAQARGLLSDEAVHLVGRHGRAAIKVMNQDLDAIETEHATLKTLASLLLDLHEKGDRVTLATHLPTLGQRQDAIDEAIAGMRRHAETLTNDAVAHADRDERRLLVTNAVLTGLAAVLGFGFAVLITRALVRAVNNLVAGTEAVEAGDLDVEVKVISQDEVGQLTGSFNTMVDGLRLKERIKDTFGKYMDPRIVSNLLDRPEFAEPGGERREMTVMFIDLKGFTSISEKLAADDLVNMINGFFGHMTDAISSNDGVVDKFMGDAVMAYWGPPFTGPDKHAEFACKAGLEALERLEVFRAEVVQKLGGEADDLEIDLRIGISTGEMVVGTIGSTASRSFTVMGDPVNLGSRLEGANKAYGTRVMISERTRELAGEDVYVRELDLIRVKGKIEPTRVYELRRKAASGDFAVGVDAYRRQDWNAAEAAFRACLESDPSETPATVYLDRVTQLRATAPPADWDGVWVFETK